MPTLPVISVRRPAVLAGQVNGRLDSAILHTWQPSWGGQPVTFVQPALRAYVALSTAAHRAGFVLYSVGSYRSYQRQVELFNERYRRVQFETNIWWDGSFWRHVLGAQAAIPGTSNHGLGLAIDVGEQLDADPSAESISQAAVNWLIVNEHRFGFSHEVQSEPWHIRYWAGDDIPDAVLAFEQGDDMSAEEVWAVESTRPSMFGVTTEEQLAETYWRVGRPGGLLETMAKLVEKIAAEVGIDAAELAALRAAAELGAREGVTAALGNLSAQEIADAISNEVAADILDLLRARLEN